jgi:hypothetical protein
VLEGLLLLGLTSLETTVRRAQKVREGDHGLKVGRMDGERRVRVESNRK